MEFWCVHVPVWWCTVIPGWLLPPPSGARGGLTERTVIRQLEQPEERFTTECVFFYFPPLFLSLFRYFSATFPPTATLGGRLRGFHITTWPVERSS